MLFATLESMDRRKRATIELAVGILVAVGIATAGLSVIEKARVSYRDSTRIHNVQDLSKALELYYTSEGGYPIFPEGLELSGVDELSKLLVVGGHIRSVPRDPLTPALQYHYRSNQSGTDYRITFCIEGEGVNNFTKGCDNEIKP